MRRPRTLKPEAAEKLREIYTFIRERKVVMHHLSMSLGLSASMVGKYLSGQNKPTNKNFIKLLSWYESQGSVDGAGVPITPGQQATQAT